MAKVTIFLSILVLGAPVWAADCFLSEINPHTKKIYASEKVYSADIEKWQTKMPENPGMPALVQAYAIYSKEKPAADALKSDKKAHCFIGCRISQELDFKVASYVGWFKEDQDVRDCNKKTHFDPADFIATLKGAQAGQSATDAKACLSACTTK